MTLYMTFNFILDVTGQMNSVDLVLQYAFREMLIMCKVIRFN
jgi:hypothetical protein